MSPWSNWYYFWNLICFYLFLGDFWTRHLFELFYLPKCEYRKRGTGIPWLLSFCPIYFPHTMAFVIQPQFELFLNLQQLAITFSHPSSTSKEPLFHLSKISEEKTACFDCQSLNSILAWSLNVDFWTTLPPPWMWVQQKKWLPFLGFGVVCPIYFPHTTAVVFRRRFEFNLKICNDLPFPLPPPLST